MLDGLSVLHFLSFLRLPWDHNPPLTPPRRGAVRAGQFPSWEGSGVGWSAPGSWKALIRLRARIGIMNLCGEIVARASRPCVSIFTTEQKLTGGTPVPLTSGSGRARDSRIALGTGESAVRIL